MKMSFNASILTLIALTFAGCATNPCACTSCSEKQTPVASVSSVQTAPVTSQASVPVTAKKTVVKRIPANVIK